MRFLRRLIGGHWHDWEEFSAPTDEDTRWRLRVAGYPKELQEREWYRRCRECGHIQGLDIDGWCDFIFKNEAAKDRLRAKVEAMK